MKILVYGAGVVGSVFAAKMQAAGHDVTILARGARYNEIKQSGIVIEDLTTRQRTLSSVPVIKDLSGDLSFELAIIALPKYKLSEIMDNLMGCQNIQYFLFMLNSASDLKHIVNTLGFGKVIFGYPGFGGSRDGYLVKYTDGTRWLKDTTVIGELDGGISGRIKKVKESFEAAGLPTTITRNIDALMKSKTVYTLPITLAYYMSGRDIKTLLKTPDALLLMVQGMKEGLRVLKTLRIPYIPADFSWNFILPEPLLIHWVKGIVKNKFTNQTIIERAKASSEEISHICNEFRALVKQAGIETPALEKLYVYVDSDVQPVKQGSHKLKVNWTPFWIGVGMIVTTLIICSGALMLIK